MEKYIISNELKDYIYGKSVNWGFDLFSQIIFYRTYSRVKDDGTNESFQDVVVRVIEGIMSIKKDYHIKHNLKFKEDKELLFGIAKYMLEMKFLPAGRGLWCCGTEQMYTRGSACLFNCGAVTTKDLIIAVKWSMSMLMLGVGIGFDTIWDGTDRIWRKANKNDNYIYIIEDSREGWVDSVVFLLYAYSVSSFPIFDYSKLRPSGTILKTFGGVSQGCGPLRKLHSRIEQYMDSYTNKLSSCVRTVVDIINSIGACVVAGNIRRSAEIALGNINDKEFIDIKNLDKNPERSEIYWLSNNSCLIKSEQDYKYLEDIIDGISKNGEPGIINIMNIQRYARMHEEKRDDAYLINPCAEIPLESFELCNISEVFPSNCEDEQEIFNAMRYATFYCSNINLLNTGFIETDKVINKNRRIGVSLSGIAEWITKTNPVDVQKILEIGYRIVKTYNAQLALESKIPKSIRVTTVKPSGTISLLAGTTSGIHYAIFNYAIRRVRVANNFYLVDILKNAGIKWEKDFYSDNTLVFEFPIKQDRCREQDEVSLWEQIASVDLLQSKWADNAVSCTLYFDSDKKEELLRILQIYVPKIKSISLLPRKESGVYKQMPYERITKDKYYELQKKIMNIDLTSNKRKLIEACGEMYCDSQKCIL